jgi:hypothetical protein
MACFLLAAALLTVVIAALLAQRKWEQAQLRHADPAITQARARHPAGSLPPLRPLTNAERRLLADADWDHIWDVIGDLDFRSGGESGG